MSNKKIHVVIVGGGFGGVKTALQLDKVPGCRVTLISDHGHFRYYPALYHAATGGKRAGSRIRLSNILQGTKVKLVRATITKLDRAHKSITTADGQTFAFDKLVLGLGNITNYFGIKGLPEYSFGIKSTEEVERFKQHVHQQFVEHGCPDLNYVIVGGGPTGIELAGALPAYLKEVMRRHAVKDCKLNMQLVEAAPVLLPRSHKTISEAVTRRLQQLGIQVMTNTAVGGQTPDTLMAGDTPLKTRTVVWTAGVTNNPFFKDNGFNMSDRGKVEVDEYLQAEQDIYVIGDNANTMFSGMAQTALYDATFVAKNICREVKGRMPQQYVPVKPISVIPVGRHWAAVEWGKAKFYGFRGWLLHIFVDLIAFHDLENWPKAGEQWMRNMERSDAEICPICAKK